MKTDATCLVFLKRDKTKVSKQIEKMVKCLEKDYIVTQASEPIWNPKHQDFEVWLFLLHKDSLGGDKW